MSGSNPDGGLARPGAVNWPLLSGVIPQLADSHVPPHETGLGRAASLARGAAAVLIPSDDAGRSLGGLGGTGKTQLALAVAHALWDRRALDLVVWMCPSTRDAVVTAYAQAMRDIGQAAAGEPAETAASRFLDWLTQTSRPWLIILDDLGDAAVLEGLWPHGPPGRGVGAGRGRSPAGGPTPRCGPTARARSRWGRSARARRWGTCRPSCTATPTSGSAPSTWRPTSATCRSRWRRQRRRWPTPGWTAATTGSGSPTGWSAGPAPRP